MYQFGSFILNLPLPIFVWVPKMAKDLFWAIELEKYIPVKSTKYG